VNGRLPDFVIVGAQRSGSTSLYRYLEDHPEVFMAKVKELHFFDRHFDRGLGWYCQHFAGASPMQRAGEATPRYMASAPAIERLGATLPEARLLAILRDPVERAYSHYWMERARGRDDRSFEAAIAAEEEHNDPEILPAYLGQGRYIGQLERICRWLPRRQLHVIIFEDLLARPGATFAEICRFLQLDDAYRPAGLGRPVNQFVDFRSLKLRRAIKLVPRSLPVLSRALGRLNTSNEGSYPPLSPATRGRLAAYFAHDNEALAAFLGRDLPSWTTQPGRKT
jgi:hypothetical protein